jgi:tripartite-type tricarboxylate transporter receptor subunit TctC
MPTRARVKLSSAFVLAAFAFAVFAYPAAAEDAADYYKGKTIKWIVPTPPGGGFDAYSRMIAPLVEKETGATVVVQNTPGAGGLVAANAMYIANGDALMMGIVNGNAAALAQIVDDPSVRFDMAKYGLLGLITTSPWVWTASPKSKMQTIDDFRKANKIIWSGSGQMGGLSDGAAVTCEALQLKCSIIRGYQGSAQGALALARGETDAMYVSDGSANNYVANGDAKPVVTISTERSRFFKDLPTIFEAVKLTPEQKFWFELRAAVDNVQRTLAMPPNVAADKLAYMQKVVKKILTDPAVIADGDRTERYINYKSPEEVQKMVDTILVSITPEQKKKVKEVILKE